MNTTIGKTKGMERTLLAVAVPATVLCAFCVAAPDADAEEDGKETGTYHIYLRLEGDASPHTIEAGSTAEANVNAFMDAGTPRPSMTTGR